MEAVILVIHLIVSVSLVIVIMIQPSEAGGFMGTGSMSNLMAPRRSADVMTRATTILAGCFFATSLFLAIAASHHPAAKSILDVDAGKTEQSTTAPAATNTTTNTTETTTTTDTNTVDTNANDNAANTGKKPGKKPVKSDIPKAPVTK